MLRSYKKNQKRFRKSTKNIKSRKGRKIKRSFKRNLKGGSSKSTKITIKEAKKKVQDYLDAEDFVINQNFDYGPNNERLDRMYIYLSNNPDTLLEDVGVRFTQGKVYTYVYSDDGKPHRIREDGSGLNVGASNEN